MCFLDSNLLVPSNYIMYQPHLLVGILALNLHGFLCLLLPGIYFFFLLLFQTKLCIKLRSHVELFLDEDEEEGEARENDRQSPHILKRLRIDSNNLALNGSGKPFMSSALADS